MLKPIEDKDLLRLWEISYKHENPDWVHWDAPYLHEYLPLTWQEFLQREVKFFQSKRTQGIYLNGEIIGAATYQWKNHEIKWLEVGLSIFVSELWGNGYGSQAMKNWVTQVFLVEPDVASVGFSTWSANERVMSMGKTLGFKLEGRARKVIFYNDSYYDAVRMGILREEWFSQMQTTFLNNATLL